MTPYVKDLVVNQGETMVYKFPVWSDSDQSVKYDLTGVSHLAVAKDGASGAGVLPSSPYTITTSTEEVTTTKPDKLVLTITMANAQLFTTAASGAKRPTYDAFLIKDGVSYKVLEGKIDVRTSNADPTSV